MSRQIEPLNNTEKAILVQVNAGKYDPEIAKDSLNELEKLAETAGVVVAGTITQHREKINPAFFIGKGKLVDIQYACRQSGANLVIFDNELSPTQVNNLDMALGVKVIDRTELILQIFARRARTNQAKLQVELAQLEYLVSRIPVSEKQPRFRGGIGMRGPGESPFKLRAYPMRRRIMELRKKIEEEHTRQLLTRKQRRRWPVVSLVGYTNVGKTTLLNAFSRANAYVDDRLFATLDTRARLVYMDKDTPVILTDTVGFIRNLPHRLIASFKSTLDEIKEANLLLIVCDVSHPFVFDHLKVVKDTLEEIGADKIPSIIVGNKIDTVEAVSKLPIILEKYPSLIPVSARNKIGLDLLKVKIVEMIKSQVVYGHA